MHPRELSPPVEARINGAGLKAERQRSGILSLPQGLHEVCSSLWGYVASLWTSKAGEEVAA